MNLSDYFGLITITYYKNQMHNITMPILNRRKIEQEVLCIMTQVNACTVFTSSYHGYAVFCYYNTMSTEEIIKDLNMRLNYYAK